MKICSSSSERTRKQRANRVWLTTCKDWINNAKKTKARAILEKSSNFPLNPIALFVEAYTKFKDYLVSLVFQRRRKVLTLLLHVHFYRPTGEML